MVDSLSMESPKTSLFYKLMKEHGWAKNHKKVLMVAEGYKALDLDDNLAKSLKNVPNTHLLPSQGANVYDIVKSDYLVISEEGLKQLIQRITKH